jgi:hypothetical protein
MDVITRPDTEGRHEALRIGGKNVETDARLKVRFSPLWRSRPARLSGSDGRRPVVTWAECRLAALEIESAGIRAAAKESAAITQLRAAKHRGRMVQ